MKTDKIPLGIIGCGGHACHHTTNLGENFEVVAACDPNNDALIKIAAGARITSGSDITLVLNHPRVQAVLIASPDEQHLDQVELALATYKHVFCEKPLLVPGQDIGRLVNAFKDARERKLTLTTCHPRRMDRPFMWLKKMLMEDVVRKLGKVISFSFDFSYHKPVAAWKGNRSLLLDHLNHEVDLMSFLFGIKEIQAWKHHDGPDRYEVVGIRGDGITFRMQGTRRLDSKKYHEFCSIRFVRGEIVLDMMMGTASIHDHEHDSIQTVGGLTIDYDGRLERVMDDFAKQIRKGVDGYLYEDEMLFNTLVGLKMQGTGIQQINVPRIIL